MGAGVNAQVRTLGVWDDGGGAKLYVGGDFTEAGGIPSPHLARWNGSRWENVLDGLNGSPYTMAVYGNELYVGGYFDGNTAGDLLSPNIVKVVRAQCCIADYNGDQTVSVQDIFDFLAGYFSGDARADVNGDGQTSVQDIFDFLAAYFTGCDF
jgi:hypothetical protein